MGALDASHCTDQANSASPYENVTAAPATSANIDECLIRRDFETYTPQVRAVRIDMDEAPVIDGDLSDSVWARAELIDEFYQVEPTAGATPSQPTRAYILYDEKTLYVGVYAYDSEPDLIRHGQMKRDPRLRDDDAIRILIDSRSEEHTSELQSH